MNIIPENEREDFRRIAETYYADWLQELQETLERDRTEYEGKGEAIISTMMCMLDGFLLGAHISPKTLSDLLSKEATKARYNFARKIAIKKGLDITEYPEKLVELYDRKNFRRYFGERIGMVSLPGGRK